MSFTECFGGGLQGRPLFVGEIVHKLTLTAKYWFCRGIATVIVWVGCIYAFLLPSLIFIMQCFDWLGNDRWVHLTLCNVDDWMKLATKRADYPSEIFEKIRCDVSMPGWKGLEHVVRYLINDVSIYLSIPILAAPALFVLIWATAKVDQYKDQLADL
jgi:hypothetical protein